MKCPYCESMIDRSDFAIIKHIKECQKTFEAEANISISISINKNGPITTNYDEITVNGNDWYTVKDKVDKWIEFAKSNMEI